MMAQVCGVAVRRYLPPNIFAMRRHYFMPPFRLRRASLRRFCLRFSMLYDAAITPPPSASAITHYFAASATRRHYAMLRRHRSYATRIIIFRLLPLALLRDADARRACWRGAPQPPPDAAVSLPPTF